MSPAVIDSHIHLWPGSDANSRSHTWMSAGDHLAKQYSVDEYLAAANSGPSDLDFAGFVYVETDRTVLRGGEEDVAVWAAEPLKEIAFLRRVVEGTPRQGEGFEQQHAHLIKGIVAWAPLDRPLHDFLRYMALAKDAAGEKAWSMIKGFRFLLQGIKDEAKFRALLNPSTSSFVSLLVFLGSRNLSFDVGVDQRQGGVWQLEYMAEAIEATHKDAAPKDKTVFIINHLCKPNMENEPDFSGQTRDDFNRWKSAISRMAKQDRVYMKLSGAFSEIADQSSDASLSAVEVVNRMRPWIDHVFNEFGPWKIMFGSDWPVCNVRGPGDEKSWNLWMLVVGRILEERNLSELEKNRVWHGTAIEAYKLDHLSR